MVLILGVLFRVLSWQPPPDVPLYLDPAAQLEADGLEDPAAYLAKRNARIRAELDAMVAEVRATGRAIEGFSIDGRHVLVDAEQFPHLFSVEMLLSVLCGRLQDAVIAGNIRLELVSRGFPLEDIPKLMNLMTGKNEYRIFGRFAEAFAHDFIQRNDFSDEAIRAYILAYEAKRSQLDTEWTIQLLSGLSLTGRRVLLSYAFETHGRRSKMGYSLPDIPQQEIERRRAELRFQATRDLK